MDVFQFNSDVGRKWGSGVVKWGSGDEVGVALDQTICGTYVKQKERGWLRARRLGSEEVEVEEKAVSSTTTVAGRETQQ